MEWNGMAWHNAIEKGNQEIYVICYICVCIDCGRKNTMSHNQKNRTVINIFGCRRTTNALTTTDTDRNFAG